MKAISITGLANWSAPKTVQTSRGARSLRTATPDGTFWAAWREDKDALRAAGVSVGKSRDTGAWEVCWWSASDSISEAPVQASKRSGARAGVYSSTADAASGTLGDTANNTPASAVSVVEQAAETIFGGGRRAKAREVAFLPATAAPTASVSGGVTEVMATERESFPDSEQTNPPCKVEGDVQSRLAAGMSWSSEQEAIFAWFKSGAGNLVVQARAGTGKTTTIKQAFTCAPEGRMLYAVFNKKNQREAVAKITDPRVEVKTLHSLGYSYIASVWPGSKPDDAVEGDRIRAACPGIPDEAVTAVERLVGFAKNLFTALPSTGQLVGTAVDRGVFCSVQDQDGQDEFPVSRLAEVARTAMEAALKQDAAKRVSFSDMVWLPVAQRWTRPRYDLVVVDEAQDMNLPQLLMARQACRKGGRVCVVGDERQAIYGFRGAAQDGMAAMKVELGARVLGLTTTYRCPKKVVALAAATVPDYKAAPEAPEGAVGYCDEGELYEKIAVGDAVLSRANAPLMGLCLGLLRKGVPARIEGRDIGRQLLGMVKKLKARSVPDFLRRLSSWADKQRARLNVGKLGPAKCAVVDDQQQTLEALAEGCANVSEVEARIIALFQDSDENSRPAVVLSSVHKAKGLEWDRVAMLSWTFNRTRKGTTDEQRREEENIHYVAATRAKRELWLVSEGGQGKPKANPDGTKEVAA